MNRRFPGSPNIDQTNPFEDERGANPFGDKGMSLPVKANPYGGPADRRSRPYQPNDFETTFPSRSGLVLTCGISGVVLVTIGVVLSVLAVLVSIEWPQALIYGAPFNFLGLVVSVPGWIFGRHDRRAMKAGAMETKGRRGTNIGYLLGILGTIIGTLPAAGLFVALLAEAILL
ncbi:MAG: hypothetical protein ACC628_04205 [Pirellulaceae bacterium]